MAQAATYIADKLKKFDRDVPFTDDELSALIAFHPTRKHMQVKSFIRQARPPFNKVSLFVITKNGIFDASTTKCLRNMYGKFDADREKRKLVIQAFRQETNLCTSMIQARTEFTIGPCALCGKNCKLSVDHKDTPFSQMLDTFLNENSLKLSDVKVRWVQRAEYLLRDAELSKKWRLFHDAHATFQGLCRKCNSAKGSGGYKLAN